MSFDNWITDLERRHLADLQFNEVSRALRALSSAYVERRGRLKQGAALSGAGKRAAFALFYGPLHFLTVREAVRALGASASRTATLTDLGCGTGAAGAAWADSHDRPPEVLAIDLNEWALRESLHTYRAFGIRARTRRESFVSRVQQDPAYVRTKDPAYVPTNVRRKAGEAVLAAYALNELDEPERRLMLDSLLRQAQSGATVLIVEPLARAITPWWGRWRTAFEAIGGRADEWRFKVDLPPIVAKLDRAAGLDHRELTARTIYAGAGRSHRS